MNYPPGMPPFGRGGSPAGPPAYYPPPSASEAVLSAILAELREGRMERAQLTALIARGFGRPDGGDNPFGYPPRAASVNEFGVGHSGPAQTFMVEDGRSVSTGNQLLNCALKEIVPQGYYGMATVHVSTKLLEPNEPGGATPNAVLIGTLEWQSGTAGGREVVDLTRGAVIPVGGTTSIQLSAELVSNDGNPLVAFAPIQAEATVCWETSSTQDPPMSLPAVVLTAPAGLTSGWIEIPPQAKSMLALGTPATAYSTLIAEFSVSNTAGGALVRYQVPNPFVNGAPIRNGVNFVRFVNTVGMTVFPTFELF